MNYYPDCGGDVEYIDTKEDVATQHTYWHCPRCTAGWEETTEKASEKVLHISPVGGGDNNARTRQD